jgi:hypothetical protein
MIHDIDRTQIGFGGELETFEYPAAGEVFSESQEITLAAEMLGVGNEYEFEQFLGDLISKASQAVGKFINSPTGQALGGLLKGAAKKLLPMAGQAIGNYFGGASGGQMGSQIASTAGSLFGLETEQEERDFEAAQNFVRLVGDSVKNAASAPPGANPQAVANAAVAQAAKVHAPVLLSPGVLTGGPLAPVPGTRPGAGAPGAAHARSGCWIRRHGKIVLLGV